MSRRKTVRPGVREISPVSIYGEVYGGKDLRKRCVLSLELLSAHYLQESCPSVCYVLV